MDTIEHAAELPFGYQATFTWSKDGGMSVKWGPNIPRITSPRARRKFFGAYSAARRAFMEDIATVIGGSVLIVDDDGATEVIPPASKH